MEGLPERKCLIQHTLVADKREMSNGEMVDISLLYCYDPFFVLFFALDGKMQVQRDCDVDADEWTRKGSFKMELF